MPQLPGTAARRPARPPPARRVRPQPLDAPETFLTPAHPAARLPLVSPPPHRHPPHHCQAAPG
ncbi:MAG: hypothetical protein ACRYGH_29390 [Janthinobacterium lividum]